MKQFSETREHMQFKGRQLYRFMLDNANHYADRQEREEILFAILDDAFDYLYTALTGVHAMINLNGLIENVEKNKEQFSPAYADSVASLKNLCPDARYSLEQAKLCLSNAFVLARLPHKEQGELLIEAETTRASVFVPRHTK